MPVLVVLTFRHFNTLAFINRHSIIDHIFEFILIELLINIFSVLKIGKRVQTSLLSSIKISVAASIASVVTSVVISVVVASAVTSIVPVGLEFFLRNCFFLVSNVRHLLSLKLEEIFVRDGLDVNLGSTNVSVTSSVASSVSSVVTSVVVTPSVASVVPVSLEFLLRNFFSSSLSNKLNILLEEVRITHLLDVRGGSGVKISVASSVASSVPSVIASVVITPSVTSVMPVGVILFLSNFLFFLSNLTDLSKLHTEEFFVTDRLEIDSRVGLGQSVASGDTSSISTTVACEVVTSSVASAVGLVLVELFLRDFNTFSFISSNSVRLEEISI
jgi:hypothetical protein